MKSNIYVNTIILLIISQLFTSLYVDGSNSIVRQSIKKNTGKIGDLEEINLCASKPKVRLVSRDTIPDTKATEDSPVLKSPDLDSWNAYYPTSTTIDTSLAPGSIDYETTVSPSGGKIYNVPIKVPEGMNGFRPEISICYNSQQGNGIMGKGWSLSGLSKIERVNKTLYYDNTVEGVRNDALDVFALDGIRLLPVDDVDIDDEGDDSDEDMNRSVQKKVFQTERGNIKAVGRENNGNIIGFDVFYPDGTIAVFESNSEKYGSVHFPIVSKSDQHGNSIQYQYYKNPDEIKVIEYNGNTIEFEYIDREDGFSMACGGVLTEYNRYLSKIICRYDATVVGEYEINYYTLDGYSYLNEIDHICGGEKYNPLEFNYRNREDSYDKETRELPRFYVSDEENGEAGIRLVVGRFDYSRKTDGLIMLPDYDSFWLERNSYYKNQYEGNEEILVYADLKEEVPDYVRNIYTEIGFVDIFAADIYGNQEDCVIKVNNYIENGMDKIRFSIYSQASLESVSLKKTYEVTVPTAVVNAGVTMVCPKTILTGDFDGDGKMEVMVTNISNPVGNIKLKSYCYIFDLEKNRIKYEGTPFDYQKKFPGSYDTDYYSLLNSSDRLIAMDYDGDGKTDICHINESGTEFYTFDTSQRELSIQVISGGLTFKRINFKDREVITGDFNGDGKMDIVASPVSATAPQTWILLLSLGNGNFKQYLCETTRPLKNSPYGILAQDIDGDGITDLIRTYSDSFDTHISHNSKIGSYYLPTNNNTKSSYVGINLNSHNQTSNVLGVGKKDGILTMYQYKWDDLVDNAVCWMVNSNCVVEHNEYRKISYSQNKRDDENSFYKVGDDAVFPYVNIIEDVPVLASTKKYLDDKEIDNSSYLYRNAVFHRQGLGFCGFERVLSEDFRGRKSEYVYNPYKYSILVSEYLTNADNLYTYDIRRERDGRLTINVKSIESHDKARDIDIKTTYQYDSYGNSTTELIEYPGDLSIQRNTTYVNNTAPSTGYCVGLVKTEESITKRAENEYKESIQMTSYSNLQPRVIKKYRDGNLVSQTRYSYDTFGNIVAESTMEYKSLNSLDKQYEYNPKGKVVKSTDVYGNSENYNYDNSGRLKYKTDKRGNKTLLEYDDFGRESQTNYPDGTIQKKTYNWSYNSGTGLYSIETTQTGKPMQTICYDALDREVCLISKRFDGSERCVYKEYDDFGRLKRVSLPYNPDQGLAPRPKNKVWYSYTYDEYDRVNKATEPVGKFTQYEYNGIVERITEDNIMYVKEYDALGNLLHVSDPGGEITYELCADGQPSRISVGDRIETTYEYDEYGRKTTVRDSSHGTMSYEYDNAGNIKTQTTGNHKTTGFEYDATHRLTRKTSSNFETDYSYDEYGNLVSVVSSNGTSKEYEYDKIGRLVSEKETALDKIWLKREYTYSEGNVSSLAYSFSDGIPVKVSHEYSNGHLVSQKLDEGKEIYRLLSEDSHGFPKEIQTGPVKRTYTFNRFGIQTGRRAENDTVVYWEESYTYDKQTNNLIERVTNGKKETFEYDELNRLTYYGGNRMTYDDVGNIQIKDNCGTLKHEDRTNPFVTTYAYLNIGCASEDKQKIIYNTLNRPSKITDGTITASIYYNADGDRVKMTMENSAFSTKGNTIRYYLGNCLDMEAKGIPEKKLYLGGDYYNAPVLYYQKRDKVEIRYIIRDKLGSITSIVNSEGKRISSRLYDPWGRYVNPETGEAYSYDGVPDVSLDRGFTGHEHLPELGLINMNARMYDPYLGNFISPDPYVQAPENTQSYNRYSYALNNPLKYRDPNGEFFIGTAITAIVDLFKNIGKHFVHFNRYDFSKTVRAWKIDMSMFSGGFLKSLNKWTYNGVNSLIGNIAAHACNIGGTVDKVTSLKGMLAVSSVTPGNSAFTIGHYSMGPDNYTADWKDNLFVHEYGHYIQAQIMGPMYIKVVGVPSLLSAAGLSSDNMAHTDRWFEQNASNLGCGYFNKRYGSGANGYVEGSEDYFSVDVFRKGGKSPYKNPRTSVENQDKKYPIQHTKIIFWDFISLIAMHFIPIP